MEAIVCFGDSNTWGYVPGSVNERFPREVRWPARLATALADEAEVIAEGLNGRTATIESPVVEGRNGLPYLVPCLRSHAPVDILVVYLGTNDAYWLEPLMVARSIGRLVKVARGAEAGPGGGAPGVLVVCPPPFGGHELASVFWDVCDELGCELLDLAVSQPTASSTVRTSRRRAISPSRRPSSNAFAGCWLDPMAPGDREPGDTARPRR